MTLSHVNVAHSHPRDCMHTIMRTLSALCRYQFSRADGNTMGFWSLLMYTFASVVSGSICERWFHTSHRSYLLIALALCVTSTTALWIMVPSPISPSFGPSLLNLSDPDICYYSVFAAVVAIGFTSGLTLPPVLELLAEASYPVPEGTTGECVVWWHCVALCRADGQPRVVWMCGCVFACPCVWLGRSERTCLFVLSGRHTGVCTIAGRHCLLLTDAPPLSLSSIHTPTHLQATPCSC